MRLGRMFLDLFLDQGLNLPSRTYVARSVPKGTVLLYHFACYHLQRKVATLVRPAAARAGKFYLLKARSGRLNCIAARLESRTA